MFQNNENIYGKQPITYKHQNKIKSITTTKNITVFYVCICTYIHVCACAHTHTHTKNILSYNLLINKTMCSTNIWEKLKQEIHRW